VVVYKIKKGRVYVSDPAHGLIRYAKSNFTDRWVAPGANEDEEGGIVLLLEPAPHFHTADEKKNYKPISLDIIVTYAVRYKKMIFQVLLNLGMASLLQLIVPFLTQNIVDVGIHNHDIGFIYLVMIAQLMLFAGRACTEVIRSWLLLHLSSRLNISMLSDFFIKLMKLPISFFDVKMTGDLLQRIHDNKRIEMMLTNSSLNILFSMFSLVVYSIVLVGYNLSIFLVFIAGSILYLCWIFIFMKKRKDLDYKNFSQSSQEQGKMIEIISGMQEIKLNNAEKQKRWGWENIQARLFQLRINSLALEQYQRVGTDLINEIKNMVVTIISAKLVIEGHLTLGMMMSVSYITGQLNGPIHQLISLFYSLQDAQISIERLNEIYTMPDEEDASDARISLPPGQHDIRIKDLSFRYPGSDTRVLENINLCIPWNKTTAIVGASGSGKTTLLKMLLRFYEPENGTIELGNVNLKNISLQWWRDQSGTVMQEGFIFNDSIANNIAVGQEQPDPKILAHAASVANIKDFIESLPLSYKTIIGQEGAGMSAGQKQRIMIARAVYKNPGFIFFDEATSALDANNEREIHNHLQEFFKGRTAVIIAHRLSTVKHADQIVVLSNGRITETGTHQELTTLRGEYYKLVQNQLEL
jgi:ATP-binding cassette, subfamily B, bacterial